MARLTFLWHLHQPAYTTADGHAHAPWVLLHAGGEYLTLVHALESSGWQGQVLNLTPIFLEQLAAYRDGTVRDPLLEALRTPAQELDPAGQRELLRWAFLLHPARLRRLPRLHELAGLAGGAAGAGGAHRFTTAELADLQVLLVLAYGWPNLAHEPELAELARHERGFADGGREVATAWLAGCPARLLTAFGRLARSGGVEIATSPYAHPIMPLLIDTGVVKANWAPRPAPAVPAFASPEDAARQLELGLEVARRFGFEPAGCWPPEGAVSEPAVGLYAAHSVRWLVADEATLAASLRRPVSGETGLGDELFRPWRLRGHAPVLFFRHRELSNFVAFGAAREPSEARAARRLAIRLRQLVRRVPEDAGIVIATDGENPWTAYPDGGATFLSVLASELQQSRQLHPATLSERARAEKPHRLTRFHPGSWVGGSFATWIGHPEKNRGWELLGRVRSLTGGQPSRAWLVAQGSDWWWWLGDDNPTLLAPLYDELFRAHLRDACAAAGVEAPDELAIPVRADAVPLKVPRSREWPEPALDGRITDYFEWAVAAWVDAPDTCLGLARVAFRLGEGRLWLRLDARPGAAPPAPVVVTVATDLGRRRLTLPNDLPNRCALGDSLEACVPVPTGAIMVALECRGERLPLTGFWRLDAHEVDEP